MILRPYQQEVITKIYKTWDNGAKNVLAQLATGGGKTVLLAKIIQDNDGMAIAIAHRVELVSQISLTLARHGISHNIIAQKPAIREICALHLTEIGQSFYDPLSRKCVVAGVDTLIKMSNEPLFKKINLVIQDEAHHVLRENKWGKAAAMFPNARGFYPTATPIRADGKGLGRHADGIIDEMVLGCPMRELIKMGFLTEYRIFAPPSDLDLSDVPIGASGDYSAPKLRTAVHKSHITGDVVSHYKRIADGKLGVTFAVDIKAATDIADEFRRYGVPAEVISSKTPDLLRASIMRKFRNRELLQIVNVDLLGEGVDVPAIEVVSMARPTRSYCLYSQQFGRALRPMQGKSHAIIIDHVSNVKMHGLPDAKRIWSLDRKDKKSRKIGDIPLRTCINPECLAVFKRIYRDCPNCGTHITIVERSAPEYVDGDLYELDGEVLAKLRGEVERIDNAPLIPQHLPIPAQLAIHKNHKARQEAQHKLRNLIARWAGYEKAEGKTDSEICKIFYFTFGVDVMTAQTFNVKNANALSEKIIEAIDELVNIK